MKNNMYFKDLHKEKDSYGKALIKVAWLDTIAPFETGDVPKEFINKLKKLEPRIRTKGWHTCPFCGNATSSNQFIIPFDISRKTFFDVPEMIIHYIEEHEYKPPIEFINTVLNIKI